MFNRPKSISSNYKTSRRKLKKIFDTSFWQIFLGHKKHDPQREEKKKDKYNFIKIKSICSLKNNTKNM